MISERGGFIKNRYKPDAVTLVSGGEKTGYGIDHAFNTNPTQVFMSTSNTVKINMSYLTAKTITGFGIINHNLTESADMILRYYADAGFTTLLLEHEISCHPVNTYSIIEDAPTCNYIQLYIYDAPIQYIKMGVIFPGLTFKCPTNFDYELTIEYTVIKDVRDTDEGLHLEYPDPDIEPDIPSFTKLTLNFKKVGNEFFDLYKPLIKPGKKILIPDFSDGSCFYGIIPNSVLSSQYRIYHEFSLEFLEDAICESLEVE
jgi:hypothetical protein